MPRVHLSVGMRCIKYSLFSFNIFLLVAGILLLILGGVAATLGIGGSIINLPQVAIGIVVIGILVIILSVLGCCGARTERRSLLVIYFILLLMIFIVQLSLGIASLVYAGSVSDGVTAGWNQVSNDTRTQIEGTFGCCGLNGT
jgi:ABC-type transport system involved in multi-copper enzyme maturation permease subunit